MKIVIAIATKGRRELLRETIAFMGRQTRPADALYICPASDEDFDPKCFDSYPSPGIVVHGSTGAAAQRNVIIDAAQDADVMVFFDDDFLPEEGFLAELERLFTEEPDIAVATGHVLADGATGPGYTFADGMKLLREGPPRPDANRLEPSYGGYGCNLAVRMSAVRAGNIRFDENLPLYSWWEDVDFARRTARAAGRTAGRIVQDFWLRGVHLGSKGGRTSGKRFGYSQVANIVYIRNKGTISTGVAVDRIARNILANHVKSLKPEPWVDRRGRLWGNYLALRDLVIGRIDPRRILEF